MPVLTLAVAGAALLLAGLLVGLKLRTRAALAPARGPVSIPLPPASPSPPAARAHASAASTPAPRIDEWAAEVEGLKLKLINCFGGNEGAMTRSITFERKKFSHLTEAELLKKMLYDFGRGH